MTDAFGYPFRGEQARPAWAALAAFGVATALCARFAVAFYPSVLALVPALLAPVPLVLWAGYCRRVLSSTVETGGKDDEMPAVGRLRDRFRDGVRALAVTLVYLTPPTLVLLVTLQGAASIGEEALDGGTGTVLVFGSTVTLSVALAVAYVYPAVLARDVAEGRRRPRLSPRGLLYVYRNPSYLVAWAAAFVVGLLGLGVVGQLFGGRGVPGLLAGLLAVYASVVASRVVGLGYANAR
ncbi:DUF4013 domain-containing protein [Haloarchaeobius sp. HRN-SO-5]|uniref:DUF4013 domain-containing protein n=1 Tax=Haloarchaeobius sp. HRN-SO-5 TaxID=3446118 RepID=UPI003EBD7AD9